MSGVRVSLCFFLNLVLMGYNVRFMVNMRRSTEGRLLLRNKYLCDDYLVRPKAGWVNPHAFFEAVCGLVRYLSALYLELKLVKWI